MNRRLRLLWLCLGLTLLAQGAENAPSEVKLAWQTDYAGALAQARRENKHVLLNFTGSDWCVWCHRLRDEVFLTPAFASFAETDVVLVEVDFPRKIKLPEDLQKQNAGLAQKYAVTGYPTILYLAPDGTLLGRVGYMQGGPKTFIRELRRLAAAAR